MNEPRASGRLTGLRAFVTAADDYMGPAIVERFRAEGAEVIADTGRYIDILEPSKVIYAAGKIDILVVNLLSMHPFMPTVDITEAIWSGAFNAMVHPLMRFVKAVLPQMLERRSGKIIAVTSAAPLRQIPMLAAYTAARGAQNAFVRNVGAEIACKNVQFNAIAQNYVESVSIFRPEVMADEKQQKRLHENVPAGRIAKGWECAELAVFLASGSSNFIVGQVIPFTGGWTTTL